jgi:hypothetical protein
LVQGTVFRFEVNYPTGAARVDPGGAAITSDRRTDKVCVVTASGRIGRAAALAFGREGALASAIERWESIASKRDFALLGQLLADDVVFESPIVHTPQVGRAITARRYWVVPRPDLSVAGSQRNRQCWN